MERYPLASASVSEEYVVLGLWDGRVAVCICGWPRSACGPNPVVVMHIWMVALLILSKASRHASAGGHFSIRSPKTDVAASTVKSTSSRVWRR